MVDLAQLRRTIEKAAAEGGAAIVTRAWLEEVHRDLTELARRREAETGQS